MNKRAQGLPLNTIILAIIVIVVLVVIVMVFAGRMNIFTTNLANCNEQPNHKCSSTACDSSGGWTIDNQYKCLGADKKPVAGMSCCVNTGQVETWMTCDKVGYTETTTAECVTEYKGQLDATPTAGKICCSKVCSKVQATALCSKGADNIEGTADDVTTTTNTLDGKSFCCDKT